MEGGRAGTRGGVPETIQKRQTENVPVKVEEVAEEKQAPAGGYPRQYRREQEKAAMKVEDIVQVEQAPRA